MLYFYLQELNFLLALAGLIMLAATIALLTDQLFFKGIYLAKRIGLFLWPLIISLTAGSVALSLLYSEYFGFVPCSLCWLQRIAIYPQIILALTAYIHKDRVHFPLYGMVLSIFGFVVAVYHYIYQMIPKEKMAAGVMPCLADGTADCADKIINEFGFITFPFVSAVTFALLITLYKQLKTSN